jgi:transcriptional regulator with XRE-family HTH domain
MERDAAYIASQCKYIRKMFALTQENLADAAGLTVRTIQKIESGRHVPEVQTLRSLARGLGFDIRVFSKPTPEQEKRQKEEIEHALRKTVLVPTSPIKKSNDFYSRNREWHGLLINADAVEVDDALELATTISDWMAEMNEIWEMCTASQRLAYSTEIAGLCRELEGLGYLAHFGHFRQQHIHSKETILNIGMMTFLPKSNNDGDRYGIVTLEDPWVIPEQDRPKL